MTTTTLLHAEQPAFATRAAATIAFHNPTAESPVSGISFVFGAEESASLAATPSSMFLNPAIIHARDADDGKSAFEVIESILRRLKVAHNVTRIEQVDTEDNKTIFVVTYNKAVH